jgi:hypothetical protein
LVAEAQRIEHEHEHDDERDSPNFGIWVQSF